MTLATGGRKCPADVDDTLKAAGFAGLQRTRLNRVNWGPLGAFMGVVYPLSGLWKPWQPQDDREQVVEGSRGCIKGIAAVI